MLHIGYHESTSNGLLGLGKEAVAAGADTFAFFTRNPRGGAAKPIDSKDADALNNFMKENNFATPVAHAPYTMNPCSANEGLRQYALDMMIDDFERLEYTPGCFYNFHPGSHTGQGSETGINQTAKMISDSFNAFISKHSKNPSSVLLIETMAGKGSEIGKTFEEVKAIIDSAENQFGKSLDGMLGVCLDTCHIWDGGYDIVNDFFSKADGEEIFISKFNKSFKIKSHGEILGWTKEIIGKSLTLSYKNIDIVFTELRSAFIEKGNFDIANVDLLSYRIVVVKLGYLFTELKPYADRELFALSDGASCVELSRLGLKKIIRPMYPLDDFNWKA